MQITATQEGAYGRGMEGGVGGTYETGRASMFSMFGITALWPVACFGQVLTLKEFLSSSSAETYFQCASGTFANE